MRPSISAQHRRDVLKGTHRSLPIYADANYPFMFRSTASGVATAIGTLTSELVSRGARSDGSLVKAKLASSSPADVLLQPMFNPVAAMRAIRAGGVHADPAADASDRCGACSLALRWRKPAARSPACSRGVAHLTIYLPALRFISSPCRASTASTLGHLPQLFALADVFLLATVSWDRLSGSVHAAGVRDLGLLATSRPQFFMAGFAWPREAILEAARVGQPVPCRTTRSMASSASTSSAPASRRSRMTGSGSWCLALNYFVLAGIWPCVQESRRTCKRLGVSLSLRSRCALAGVLIYYERRSGSAASLASCA